MSKEGGITINEIEIIEYSGDPKIATDLSDLALGSMIICDGYDGYHGPYLKTLENIIKIADEVDLDKKQSVQTDFGTGSILFTDLDQKISYDEENLHWDYSNKRLGIGTTTPTSEIDLRSSNLSEECYINIGGNSSIHDTGIAIADGENWKWALYNWPGEDNAFFYLANQESDSDILTVAETGKIAINQPYDFDHINLSSFIPKATLSVRTRGNAVAFRYHSQTDTYVNRTEDSNSIADPSFDFVTNSNDYFYLGNTCKVNGFSFLVDSSNSFSSDSLICEYWDGTNWNQITSANSLVDNTGNLQHTGCISWLYYTFFPTIQKSVISVLSSQQLYYFRFSLPNFSGVLKLNAITTQDKNRFEVYTCNSDVNPAFFITRRGRCSIGGGSIPYYSNNLLTVSEKIGNICKGLDNSIVEMNSESLNGSSFVMKHCATDNDHEAAFCFLRSRGGLDTPQNVQSGDKLGCTEYYGYRDGYWVMSGEMEYYIDSTPSTNYVPGAFKFETHATDESSPSRKFLITSDGVIYLGANGGDRTHIVDGYLNIKHDLIIDNNATIAGDLTVLGTTTFLNQEELTIAGPIITVNEGDSGDGVSSRYAGLRIDRSTYPDGYVLFDENDDQFYCGLDGYLLPIVRQTNLVDQGVTYWDNTSKSLKNNSLFTYLVSEQTMNVPILEVSNGTETDPSISFYNDPDTGIYLSEADTMHLVTNGVKKLCVNQNYIHTHVDLHVDTVLKLKQQGVETNQITLLAPTLLPSNYSLTLPSNVGTDGYLLSTNGSGVLSWEQAPIETRQVLAGTGLSGGGYLSSDVTISMPNVGTAGTYGDESHYPIITTDTQGRISSVSLQNSSYPFIPTTAGPTWENTTGQDLFIDQINNDPGQSAFIQQRKARGTISEKLTLQNNDKIGGYNFAAWTGSDYNYSNVEIAAYSSEAHTPTAQGSELRISTINNNTNTIIEKLRIDTSGTTIKDALLLEDPGIGSNTITVKSPTLASSWGMTLPTTAGLLNQVLSTDGSGITSWQSTSTLLSSNVFYTSSSTTTTTTNGTYTLLNGMIVNSLPSGDYLVFFNGLTRNASSSNMNYFIANDGVSDFPISERSIKNSGNADDMGTVSTKVSITTGTIRIMWRVSGSTGTCFNRELILIRVG